MSQATVRRRPVRDVLVSAGYVVLPLAAVLVVWQLATTAAGSPFFPTPADIGQRLAALLSTPQGPLANDLLPTVGRMLLGFVLGSVWGVAIGVWIGRSRGTREVVTPAIEFLRSVPATATLPLFIVLFGGGDDMRVVFIAYGTSWFVLINTAAGVASIHPTVLDVGRVFRVSPARRLFTIVLPAALPKIFAGLRIATTAALLLAIVSEFFLATNGIGFQLVQAQSRFQLVDMWCWMVVLALLGLALNAALELAERLMLGWHRRSKER